MRFIDRKTFLALPPGTVFSHCVSGTFGSFDGLSIKGESLPSDYYEENLVLPLRADDSEEWVRAVERAEAGEEVELEFGVEQRNGLFDDSERFAIWSSSDVAALIRRLAETLGGQPPA